MRKIILSFCAMFAFFTAYSQEIPYSKYLDFSKDEFKENKFKYDDYTNMWSLRKVNGLHTTVNILAIIADASEEIRPAKNDYSIMAITMKLIISCLHSLRTMVAICLRNLPAIL